MSREMGRAGIRVALLLLIPSLILLVLEPRDSPQFFIALLTAIVGLVFLLIVTALIIARRR